MIFIVAIPLIIMFVLLLPRFNHLAFNILVVLFTALGAAELSVIFTHKLVNAEKTQPVSKRGISRIAAAVLGALPAASTTLAVCFGFNALVVPAGFAAAVLWLLVSRVFSRGEALDAFIIRLAAGFAVLIYPGFLMTWLVRMSGWENAGVIILTFVFTVFASDATAWLTGMLWGKRNRGIIPASPNKSVAGFAGGAFGSIVIGVSAVLFQPEVFTLRCAVPGGAVAVGAFLGLLTGITAMLGDLAESAIKRSSGTGDSGNIIPGRGGVLDSIDSVAFAAPVFYLVGRLFFAFS